MKPIETKFVKVNQVADETELLKAPAKALVEGGTVVFPTETVYGIGANALDEVAIDKIYEAKNRPSDNPLIVHIAKLSQLEILVESIPEMAKALMRAFWPGPITFVLKKKSVIPDKVTGGLDTVAVRMPENAIALKLIELAGVPVAAPSANTSGKPSPTKAAHVIEDLAGRVDYIIEGSDAVVGLESTVLDVTGDIPVILRPGKITREMIVEVAGNCEIDPGIVMGTEGKSASVVPKSPGMKYKHYAPKADVEVVIGTSSKLIPVFESYVEAAINGGYKVAVMSFDEDLLVLEKILKGKYTVSDLSAHVFLCSQGSIRNLDEFARLLFGGLRKSDDRECQKIVVRGVEEDGLGLAIMNRLNKASAGKVTRI